MVVILSALSRRLDKPPKQTKGTTKVKYDESEFLLKTKSKTKTMFCGNLFLRILKMIFERFTEVLLPIDFPTCFILRFG